MKVRSYTIVILVIVICVIVVVLSLQYIAHNCENCKSVMITKPIKPKVISGLPPGSTNHKALGNRWYTFVFRKQCYLYKGYHSAYSAVSKITCKS